MATVGFRLRNNKFQFTSRLIVFFPIFYLNQHDYKQFCNIGQGICKKEHTVKTGEKKVWVTYRF